MSLPLEGALRPGFGVPVIAGLVRSVATGRAALEVLCDGFPIAHVVAFSIPRGFVIRHLTDTQGRFVRQGDGLAVERIDGIVSVLFEKRAGPGQDPQAGRGVAG